MSGPPADLSAILATLAQFSTPSTLPTQTPPSQDLLQPHQGYYPDGNGLANAHNAGLPGLPGLASQQQADPRLRNRPQSRSVTPALVKSAVIDPATITTWQDGLRCVTKVAAQNKMFEASIRRMMQDQRAHEMRWYSERQALKTTQASRSSSAAKALSILRSLNPDNNSQSVTPQSEDEIESQKQAELATFDRKVYAAQHSMETAMTGELKGLGVPFFGTNDDLVLSDADVASKSLAPEAHATWSPPVTAEELLSLRRKMIGHLEDLYRD